KPNGSSIGQKWQKRFASNLRLYPALTPNSSESGPKWRGDRVADSIFECFKLFAAVRLGRKASPPTCFFHWRSGGLACGAWPMNLVFRFLRQSHFTPKRAFYIPGAYLGLRTQFRQPAPVMQ